MTPPKVSVVMSVYNAENYLREAMDSILHQTFKDFEFIIINDGSTDRSDQILESYHDPRIIIINNEKNTGYTKSLNKGLRIARGEYVARMDADDISCSQRLEKETNFLKKHKGVGLIGSSLQLINESSKPLVTQKVLTGNDEIKKGLREENQFTHGSVMYRKACIKFVGMYREELEPAEDYDLWLRISEKYDVANIPEPLYKWRINFQSVSVIRKEQQDRYARFARELARERRNQGTDRLQTSSKAEIKKFLDNLPLKTKKRATLVNSYYHWGQEIYTKGAYSDALRFLYKSFLYDPWDKNTLFLILKSWLYLILPQKVISGLKSVKHYLKSKGH